MDRWFAREKTNLRVMSRLPTMKSSFSISEYSWTRRVDEQESFQVSDRAGGMKGEYEDEKRQRIPYAGRVDEDTSRREEEEMRRRGGVPSLTCDKTVEEHGKNSSTKLPAPFHSDSQWDRFSFDKRKSSNGSSLFAIVVARDNKAIFSARQRFKPATKAERWYMDLAFNNKFYYIQCYLYIERLVFFFRKI